MAQSYSFKTPPGVTIDGEIVQFLESFYRISDTPGDHDNYVDQFEEDATFIVAGKRNRGRDEIMKQRISMWDLVKERKHTVYQIFPYGNDATDFMLIGLVNYQLKTGGSKDVEWAGRAQLAKSSSGKWQMRFYQIWL
ncbi:hypothetical protein jhhlp_008759 [Lomentospora prolificans]|uniref:DUF4440 domain-containing protein n=1 Tax=Lomentospora prolificans TaxID=41688 RepID=A0A2N3MYY3_9PEZI|nr:hypothetical protein jhhlp_008759 [Lomentospora prolificans]